MSTRRLAVILSVPLAVKRVFNNAPDPATAEERLWRERAARMTLDALGHTNLTMKRKRHNEAVRYARRWFRGLFEDHPKQSDDPVATFDAANLLGFERVRDEALAIEPLLFQETDDPYD